MRLKPIRRLLVANRGEIAVRIMRTCREHEIDPVAVYSTADRTALHLSYATEAHHLGPAPVRDSYLRVDRLMEIARTARVDALHPGYGFLAESAQLAQACEAAGITFVGPPSGALALISDKTRMRQVVAAAGVPVLPGSETALTDPAQAQSLASQFGYPLMLKAAAGTGGHGLHVVRDPAALVDRFLSARQEAEAAFGDGGLYLERFLSAPRHVEIQVFADVQGQVIPLNERECSIQRRWQKVLAESPSPFVGAELRTQLAEAACNAARAVGLVGAGTVEFLLEPDGRYHFLELVGALSVEHPLTEVTTGYDLIEAQLKVAEGRPLELESRFPRGHALCARIYAESPARGFMPSPGRISHLRVSGGFGVRVDAGAYPGYEVTTDYESLIAKLTVWGRDRARAVARMDRALSEFVVNGVDTNVLFLRRVVQHESFIWGDTHTNFVDQHVASTDRPPETHVKVAMIAAAIRQYEYAQELADKLVTSQTNGSAWRQMGRIEGHGRFPSR